MFPLLPRAPVSGRVGTSAEETLYRPNPDRRASLAGLPTELHLLIAERLTYPDALSLKFTSRHFFYLVDTGVTLKVDWLMECRNLDLKCPYDGNCDLRSDLRFCRGSVKLLMQRRREHLECESRPGLGCLIFGTTVCVHRRSAGQRWLKWLRSRLSVEMWWFWLALFPVFLGCVWMAELAISLR
ncbi:F-box domain-containing protein [Xylaria intraflava]|nr:F-box domain-containing protein [Xylaria intraflava]